MLRKPLALFSFVLSRPLAALLAGVVATSGCSSVADYLPSLPSFLGGETKQIPSLPAEVSSIPSVGLPVSKGHDSPVIALSVVGDGSSRQLLSADEQGHVLVWSLDNSTARQLLTVTPVPDRVAFFPERGLAAAAGSRHLQIYDLVTRKLIWSMDRIKTRVTALAFQVDGEAVLVGGADGRIYRWKYLREALATTFEEREKAFERYAGHTSVVSALVSHPFGRVFFSGDWKGSLHAWLPFDADAFGGEYDKNLFSGRFFSDLSTTKRANRGVDAGIVLLHATPDGERLVLATQDGYLEVWQIRGFELVARASVHTGLIYGMAVQNNGERIVTAGRDGFVKLFLLRPDPGFGSSPSAYRYEIVPAKSYLLKDARLLASIDDNHVVASTDKGKLLEVTLDEVDPSTLPQTPTPTPKPDEQFVDTDY